MGFTLKNAVWSHVSGITNTATSVNVDTGDGAKFGSPSVANPIRCVVVDASTSPETVKEFVDVTGVSTDTLAIVREVEDATQFPKVAWTAGWYIAPVVTSGVLTAVLVVPNTETVQAVTASTSTTSVSVTSGSKVRLTLDASSTISFTGTPAAGTGWSVVLYLIQGSGGSKVPTLGGGVWVGGVGGGSAPTWSTTAGQVDIVTVDSDGTTIRFSYAGSAAS